MNKVIYVFWTESNELTPRRKFNLEILKEKCGVELKFLNYETIENYQIPGHEFHEGYNYLSATAKSDYLRSYFMNFYGGAYCDIKRAEWNWSLYFDQLYNSNQWILGYRLRHPLDLAVAPGDSLEDEMKINWSTLIGAGAMICKPRTALTELWFSSMTNIIESKIERLREFPAKHVRDKAGWVTNSGYPLRWAEIGPETFMKSCYTFLDKLLYGLPCPALDEKYR